MTWDEFVQALRTGWRMIVLGTVIGLGLGVLAAQLSPVRYDAHASALVTVKTSGSVTELQLADQFAKSRVRSYADIAASDRVLSAVSRSLGLPSPMPGQVSTAISPDTSIIDITVSDSDPQRAAKTANEIVSQTSTTVRALDGGKTESVDIVMLTPAVAPAAPSQPQRTIYAIAGLLAGAITGFVVAAFRSARRQRRKVVERSVSDSLANGQPARETKASSHRDNAPMRQ